MMFLSYVPAEAGAIDEALPADLGLTPVESRAVVLVHYVVDRDEQTSGFGAYSLSYICFDVVGHDADAETPGRWFSHYFISSPRVRDYAIERGIPATDGVEGDDAGVRGRHPGCDRHGRRPTVDPLPRTHDRRNRRDDRRSTDGSVGPRRAGDAQPPCGHHGARQGFRDAIDRVPGPGPPDPPLPPPGAAGAGLRLPRATRVELWFAPRHERIRRARRAGSCFCYPGGIEVG